MSAGPGGAGSWWSCAGVAAVFGASAAALAAAPLLMPPSYSWLTHAISESAAQRVPGAWLGRLGLMLMGLAVLWLRALARPRWGRWGAALFGAFGVCMLGAAAFSHKPWDVGVAYDATEDLLQSAAASGMGLAFALGVVAVGVRRQRPSLARRGFDLVALAAAVVIPLAMTAAAGVAGLLQRTMFLIAYLWYALEAMDSTGAASTDPRHPPLDLPENAAAEATAVPDQELPRTASL